MNSLLETKKDLVEEDEALDDSPEYSSYQRRHLIAKNLLTAIVCFTLAIFMAALFYIYYLRYRTIPATMCHVGYCCHVDIETLIGKEYDNVHLRSTNMLDYLSSSGVDVIVFKKFDITYYTQTSQLHKLEQLSHYAKQLGMGMIAEIAPLQYKLVNNLIQNGFNGVVVDQKPVFAKNKTELTDELQQLKNSLRLNVSGTFGSVFMYNVSDINAHIQNYENTTMKNFDFLLFSQRVLNKNKKIYSKTSRYVFSAETTSTESQKVNAMQAYYNLVKTVSQERIIVDESFLLKNKDLKKQSSYFLADFYDFKVYDLHYSFSTTVQVDFFNNEKVMATTRLQTSYDTSSNGLFRKYYVIAGYKGEVIELKNVIKKHDMMVSCLYRYHFDDSHKSFNFLGRNFSNNFNSTTLVFKTTGIYVFSALGRYP